MTKTPTKPKSGTTVAAGLMVETGKPKRGLTSKPRRKIKEKKRKPTVKQDPGPPKPGTKMPDGTIYAGVSPDTGAALYVTPADTPLPLPFPHARQYAAQLTAHGHRDWRLPTKAELRVLFMNRAAIGGFNLTGLGPSGSSYWSSSQNSKFDSWSQRFRDGAEFDIYIGFHSNVRCVRSVLPFEALLTQPH
jgi:hypothetical protein